MKKRWWFLPGVVLAVAVVMLMQPYPVGAPTEPEPMMPMPAEEFLAYSSTGLEQGIQYIYLGENEVFPEWRTGTGGVDGVVYCATDSDKPSYLTPSGVEGRDCPALTSEGGARVQLMETDSQHHQLESLRGSLELLDGGTWMESTVFLQPSNYQVTVWYWRGIVRLNDATDMLRLNHVP